MGNVEQIILKIDGDSTGGLEALKQVADGVNALVGNLKKSWDAVAAPVKQTIKPIQDLGAAFRAASGAGGAGAMNASFAKLQSQNTTLSNQIEIQKQRILEAASADKIKASSALALAERLRQLQEKFQGNQAAISATTARMNELQRASTGLPAAWNSIKTALGEVSSKGQGVIRTFSDMGGSVVNSVSGIGKTLSVAFGVTAIGAIVATTAAVSTLVGTFKGLASEALGEYANFERLSSSLQALAAKEILSTGGATDMAEAMAKAAPIAAELLAWTQKLAIESPFKQEDVAQSFKLAMAYGFTTDEAKRLTQTIIDFASGTGATGESMQRIALALGQIKARGTLAGGEILQLTEAGLNVRDALLRAGTVAGLTAENFSKMQEQGLIPADAAIKAITQTLDKDFGGAAKRQANTFSGLISSLEDIKTIGLRELFESTFKAAQPLLQRLTETIGSPAFLSVIKQLGGQLGQTFGQLVGPLGKGLDFASKFISLREKSKQGGVAGREARAEFAELPGAELGLFRGVIKATFGPEVLAVIDNIITKFNQVKAVITSVVNAVTPILQNIVATVMPALARAFQFVSDNWETFKAALIAVGGALGGLVIIGTIAGLIAALANPITLIIGAAALLGAAWQSNWGGIRDTLTSVWNELYPRLQELWAWLQVNVPAAIQTLSNFWTGTLQPALAAVWGFIQQNIMPMLSTLVTAYLNLVAKNVGDLAAIWQNVLLPALSAVWGFISTSIIPLFVALANVAITEITKAVEILVALWNTGLAPALKTLQTFITTNLGPVLTWLGETILPKISQVFDGISRAIQGVIGWLNDLAGKISSITFPNLLTPGSPTPFELGLLGIAGASQTAASALSTGDPTTTLGGALASLNLLLAEAVRVMGELMGDLQWLQSFAKGALDKFQPLIEALWAIRSAAAEAGSAVGGIAAGLADIKAMDNLVVKIKIITEHIDIYKEEHGGGGGGGGNYTLQHGGWTKEGWAYLHNAEFVLSQAMRRGTQAIPSGVFGASAMAQLAPQLVEAGAGGPLVAFYGTQVTGPLDLESLAYRLVEIMKQRGIGW